MRGGKLRHLCNATIVIKLSIFKRSNPSRSIHNLQNWFHLTGRIINRGSKREKKNQFVPRWRERERERKIADKLGSFLVIKKKLVISSPIIYSDCPSPFFFFLAEIALNLEGFGPKTKQRVLKSDRNCLLPRHRNLKIVFNLVLHVSKNLYYFWFCE